MGNSIIEAQQEYFEFYALPSGIPLLLFPPRPETAMLLWDNKLRNDTDPETLDATRRRIVSRRRIVMLSGFTEKITQGITKWMGPHGPP